MHWVKSLCEVTFELWLCFFSLFKFHIQLQLNGWKHCSKFECIQCTIYIVCQPGQKNQMSYLQLATKHWWWVVTQNCLADDAMLVWLVKKTILVMTCWQYLFELHCYSCFFCLRSEKGTKGEGKWRGSSNFCGSQIMSHWKPNRQSHFEASVQLFKVQYCCDIRGRQVKRLNKTLQSERHQQRPFLDAFVCLRPKPITETTSHESYEMILKLW